MDDAAQDAYECPMPLRSPWLKFLDETSKIVTAVTALVCLYTRSAGMAYFAVGALACALSAKIAKRIIKQQRPLHGRKKTYGMPSTHASACTFFAVSVLLGTYLPRHANLHRLAVFTPLVVVPWASVIALSRVWLGYHTLPQVAGGVVFGACFAGLWFGIWVTDMGGIRTHGRELERWVLHIP